MFFRHYTDLNLHKISDFMEYSGTDKPGYRRCDYVVSLLWSQFDTTLINKTQISISLPRSPDYILYTLKFGLRICDAGVSNSFQVRVCFFLFCMCVCTFINAWVCWRALPGVVSRDTGWLINIIGQHVLMKEPQTRAWTASLALSSRISSQAGVDEILFPFSL